MNPLILLITYLGQTVDTVVMNPPFGTRIKGADMDFLCVALKVNIMNDLITWIFQMHLSNITFFNICVPYISFSIRLLLKQFIPCIRHVQEM